MKNRLALIIALCAAPPLLCQAGTFQVTPAVSLREEFNDNIFWVANDAENDLITTVVPQVELVEKTEKLTMRFSSALEATDYLSNDDFDALDHAQKGRVEYQLTPCVKYSASLDFTQDSRPDRELQTSGLILNNAKRESVNGSAGVQYMLTEKLRSLVTMTYGDSDFKDPNQVDSTLYGLSGDLYYHLGTYLPRTTGRLSLGHHHFDYPLNTVKNYALSWGLSHALTESYKVSLNIGPRYSQSSFRGEVSDTLAVGGDFALDYSGETTSLNLTLSRDEQGVSGRAGTAERTALSLAISKNINADLRCGLGVEYRNNHSAASLASLKVDTDTFSLVPRVRYVITKDIGLEGEYRYTQYIDRAGVSGEETRDRNQAYVRLTYQHSLFD